MNVFISSVIGGLGEFRDVVDNAITTLGHNAIRAEDFNASPQSPRLACLQEVRDSGGVVLIVGERYGDIQQSGLSATHEEYREARNSHLPIIVMVQNNVNRETQQENFLQEVRDWASGLYTGSFNSTQDLYTNTIRSLHELDLQRAQGPVNTDETLSRALAELSQEDNLKLYNRTPANAWNHFQEPFVNRVTPQSASIALSLSCGPTTSILRPAQVESQDLKNSARDLTLRGNDPLFIIDDGAQTTVDDGNLIVMQKERFVRISEQGTITYVSIINHPGGLFVIIEENVIDEISRFIEFANSALDHLDDSNRLSHCGIAALLLNAAHSGWKTRAQHEQNPNEVVVHVPFSSRSIQPVSLSPPVFPRNELMPRKSDLAQDLTIKLRRMLYS